ncbi:RNA polymerase sigma factor [Streptomyces adelaidensis]|uniref:RNA polymerase sigma factor n=1 Tax=Streptomyces adelaidensis TaxID=2796465 RepID=UPI001905B777|nr:RNA polymerase sigma factor [Streptomyces adelaidensis]
MREDSPEGTEQPEESVESVYRRRRGELVGRARKLLQRAEVPSGQADAEDIVQRAVAAALGSRSDILEPRAYLHRVIEREVEKEGRERRRRYEVEIDRSRDLLEIFAQLDTDHARIVDNRLAVRAALGELPPEQRKAVYATKGLGYSQRETAKLLGKKPGTIGVQVAQAVAVLASLLATVVVCTFKMLSSATSWGGPGHPGSPSGPALYQGWPTALLFTLLFVGAGLAPMAWWAYRSEKVRQLLRLSPPPGPRRLTCPHCSQRALHRELTAEERSWVIGIDTTGRYRKSMRRNRLMVCPAPSCRRLTDPDDLLVHERSKMHVFLPDEVVDPLGLREEPGSIDF